MIELVIESERRDVDSNRKIITWKIVEEMARHAGVVLSSKLIKENITSNIRAITRTGSTIVFQGVFSYARRGINSNQVNV